MPLKKTAVLVSGFSPIMCASDACSRPENSLLVPYIDIQPITLLFECKRKLCTIDDELVRI
jgi:hypothetical protein